MRPPGTPIGAFTSIRRSDAEEATIRRASDVTTSGWYAFIRITWSATSK